MKYKFNQNKVKGLMAENDMNPSDLSRVIDTTEMTVRNKLSGKTNFTANEICLIATHFNIKPSILFVKATQ